MNLSPEALQISNQWLYFIKTDLGIIAKIHYSFPLDVMNNKSVSFLSVRWLHTHLH